MQTPCDEPQRCGSWLVASPTSPRHKRKEFVMKKTVQWIVASLAIGVVASAYAGSSVPSNTEIPGTDDQVTRSIGTTITTYYSDATLTTEVGSCIVSTCPGSKGVHCTGTRTQFGVIETETCI
jgi:hypothetical protein